MRVMTARGAPVSAPSALASLRVFAQQLEEGRSGVRERRAAAVRGPQHALVREAADGDGGERAALKLLGDAHVRDEGDADLLLHEAFDRLHGRQLQADVERRVL